MKPSFPYLVDISLSNECGYFLKCPISDKCYAAPKNRITHQPDLEYIKSVLDMLYQSNVFEIVLGGESEPTVFRDIVEVVKYAKELDFTIGVTTRNYNFLKSEKFQEFKKYVDSMAFSVNTNKEVDEAIDVMMADNFTKHSFQDIIGIKPYDEWVDFVHNTAIKIKDNYLDASITFLGYKDFGNGASTKPYEYPKEWMQVLKDVSKLGIDIGVDSVLCQNYRDELIEVGVPERYLVGKEGESTCYIDIERKLLKPSSFTNESYPLVVDRNNFLDTFSKF